MAQFQSYEEECVIQLAFEYPEFFDSIIRLLEPEHFERIAPIFIFTIIKQQWENYNEIPSRNLVRDLATKLLTVDDIGVDEIVALIDKPVVYRDLVVVKEEIIAWARHKAFGMIYNRECIEAWERGDTTKLEEVFEESRKITDISDQGLWYFNNLAILFEKKEVEHFTCGFRDIDAVLNEGGPTRGEVLVWLAPTGVGKSIAICNSGASNVMQNRKVLHITLELSKRLTGLRYMGIFSKVSIKKRIANKKLIENTVKQIQNTYPMGDLVIYKFPAEEITADTISTIIAHLRRHKNWVPDVVLVDYMELMKSRGKRHDDRDDYSQQKHIATELCGLAAKENVFIITATQSNRDKSAGEDTFLDVNKVAESYGKMMSIDYCISINVSPKDIERNRMRLFIAKNRNGPKFKKFTAGINYNTMSMSLTK